MKINYGEMRSNQRDSLVAAACCRGAAAAGTSQHKSYRLALVSEQDILVRRERVEVLVHVQFGLITHFTELRHGWDYCVCAIARGCRSSRDSGVNVAQVLSRCFHVRVDLLARSAETSARKVGQILGGSRQQPGLDHFEKASGFQLDVGHVLLLQDFAPSPHLRFRHHTEFAEELDIFGRIKHFIRIGRRLQVGQPTLGSLDRPLVGVAIAVENSRVVLPESIGHDIPHGCASFNRIGECCEGISVGGVENGKREIDVLVRSHRTELEPVAAERERRRAVAVLEVDGHGWDSRRAEVEVCLLSPVPGQIAAGHDSVDVCLHQVASVKAHDGRRGFLGAKPVVIAGSGHSGAQSVSV